MVAISLYRGNLHRVPDVPRRWLMPQRRISLNDFKNLLQRRNKSLSRIRSASSSNPNPDSNPQFETPRVDGSPSEVKVEGGALGALKPGVQVEVTGGLEVKDGSEKPVDELEIKPEKEGGCDTAGAEGNANLLQVVEKPNEEAKTNEHTIDKADELNENEKRKRDVEEKLQVLNARKHNLVQVLKQILNVEEEFKRRNSMQDMAIHAAALLPVEVPNDSGSLSRQVTPRVGTEANLAGENGGEADDISNQNVHSRHMFRMSSTSPSSESPLRRPPCIQHNMVPYPARATMAVSGSPSCFAPIINQGHQGNLPTVSMSGTNYMASSPSPAASGGTSAFKDARQPSPWN